MIGYGPRAVEIGRDHPSVIRGGVREGCDAGHVATGPHVLLAADATGLVDLDSARAGLDADALQPNLHTGLASRSDEDAIHHQRVPTGQIQLDSMRGPRRGLDPRGHPDCDAALLEEAHQLVAD